jgi:hypothetical protein
METQLNGKNSGQWLRLTFYISGGYELGGLWWVVRCGGADSILQF